MISDQNKIISSAPGRAGILGNPTDMYGGAVISCSVGMRANALLRPNSTLTLSTGNEEVEIRGPRDLHFNGDRFDIARAVLDYLGLPERPYRIEYGSSIPLRSGLSGSTALLVALLQAMLAWQNRHPHKYELAETARYIEYNHLKIVGGFQDAYMCVFGGLNYMDFSGKQFDQKTAERYATIEPLPVPKDDLPFVLATTGVQRVSGEVHKPLGKRWLQGEPAVVEGYRRIRAIGQMGKKALLNEDWPQLGALMNENHRIQRELGGSGESNERLIAAALEAGAPGAKLAGAGEGGTIIALWPHEDNRPLEKALREAGAAAFYCPTVCKGATLEYDD